MIEHGILYLVGVSGYVLGYFTAVGIWLALSGD